MPRCTLYSDKSHACFDIGLRGSIGHPGVLCSSDEGASDSTKLPDGERGGGRAEGGGDGSCGAGWGTPMSTTGVGRCARAATLKSAKAANMPSINCWP